MYVIHGWIGLERFRNERLAATQALDGFNDGNCFHDGKRRLRVVDHYLDQILEERRRSDHISQPLVYMVKDMLNEHPAARPNCLSLYHRAHTCIKESKDKLQQHQNSNSNTTPLPQARVPPGPVPNHPNEVPGSPYSYQLASYVPPIASSSSVVGSLPPTSPDGGDWRYAQQVRPQYFSGLSNGSESLQSEQLGISLNNVRSAPELIGSMEDIMPSTVSPTTPPPMQQIANIGTPRSKGKAKEVEPPPRWSVDESLTWKKDHKKKKSRTHISRFFSTDKDKDKFIDVEGKTHLKELKNRDHVSLG